ncbi:MAG TPA: tetratricopeptide repeat protein [Vicinamibacterales bacterium]
MKKAAILALLVTASLYAQDAPRVTPAGDGPDPWFGTFSIIAFDPATNELGVGVQSRAFGAGAAVPYAKPGVGAVATQASANRQYGPKAIALLEQGLSPAEVVKRITDEDPGRDTRQVAVIDSKGRSAVYTGKRVIDRNNDPKDLVHLGGFAGHVTGESFSAQGNTLASSAVVEAMAAAYRNGKGSMAERLMDALDAGQSKGGDTRGMQSAGILVVKPLDPKSESTVERIVDLRVDDSAEPFKELRRLLNMTLGIPQRLLTSAAGLSKAGRHAEAAAEAKKALEINPRNEQAMYALARIYAASGDSKLAIEQLSMAISRQPRQWKAEAANDAAFEKLRAMPEFQRLIKP